LSTKYGSKPSGGAISKLGIKSARFTNSPLTAFLNVFSAICPSLSACGCADDANIDGRLGWNIGAGCVAGIGILAVEVHIVGGAIEEYVMFDVVAGGICHMFVGNFSMVGVDEVRGICHMFVGILSMAGVDEVGGICHMFVGTLSIAGVDFSKVATLLHNNSTFSFNLVTCAIKTCISGLNPTVFGMFDNVAPSSSVLAL
jgi:hypothetical protein